MRKYAGLLLLFAVVALAAPAGKKFGTDAVWQPKPPDEEATWADMRQCGAMMAGGSPGSFESCVGEAMRKHGAPEAAIAFNRATGGNACATRFRPYGVVDVMEALNPFQANSNDQLYFVNGNPPAISADEQAMKLKWKTDPSFQPVRKKYPEAFLFPHAEMRSLELHESRTGQLFALRFPIVNGCHACERVGWAEVTYWFVGTKLQLVALAKVTP